MLEYLKKRSNKTFYMTVVGQGVVVVQLYFVMTGQGEVVTELLKNNILLFTDAVCALLATVGLFNDPTTPGLGDKE